MIHSIGSYEGVDVSLEWRAGHQIIIFSAPGWAIDTAAYYAIRGLANALSFSGQKLTDVGRGGVRIEIVHNAQVDTRIQTLVDLLITARYEHPTMVQLRLADLDETEARRLTEALP